MAHNVDYVEFKKKYFNHQTENEPSQLNLSNKVEKNIDNNLDISNLMTILADSKEELHMSNYNEIFEDDYLQEITYFKSKLSKHANETLNKLYDIYGMNLYTKMIHLMRNKEAIEWSQIENQLILGNLDLMVEDDPFDEKKFGIQKINIDEFLNYNPDDESEEDLDYLDALVQQDYRRLSSLPSDKGEISSIFSEIIENEQQCTSNYQDEIFSKNIELIFNSNIDLDSSDWQSSPELFMDKEQDSNSQKINYSEIERLDDGKNSKAKEILQNLENTVSDNLFENIGMKNSLDKEITDTNSQEELANQERVVIRKIIDKKKETPEISLGTFFAFFLSALLMISFIIYIMMSI